MKENEKIEQEIQRTLELFDRAERLPPDPHFYARVMARLEGRGQRRDLFPAILKPALLTALVVINVGMAVWYLAGGGRPDQTGDRRRLIAFLADDLNPGNDQRGLFFDE